MKGKCYYCNKELTERTIKRHVKSCPALQEKINYEIKANKGTRNQFIISIKPKYNKSKYCIYLSIDENLQLQHLDKFIRDVWVECCGHLSAFCIDGVRYNDNSDDLYQMNVKLKDVLSIGTKFEYEYDFGDTTEIILEVVEQIKVSRIHSQIEILARNNENNCNCSKCGDKAEYYQYTTGDFLCEKCAHKLDEDEFENEIEELYGDYFNSPRDGVCGYVGDKDAELPYMPGNNNKYKISRKKPQLEEDEFDFLDDDLYENLPGSDDLLNKLLSYAASCNGKITEDDVENILNEEISNIHFNLLDEALQHFNQEMTKLFMKGIFSFELEKLLNGYTKTQCKELSQNFGIKISSNSNKSTYVKKLNEAYPEYIKNEIYNMDEGQFKKLKKYINNKGIFKNIEENLNSYLFFMKKGILFPCVYNNNPAFVMPHLIQSIFNEMNTLEVRNKIKNNTEILNLFRGMIKAYGILSYDDTIMLLKRYMNNLDEEDTIKILKENRIYYMHEYCVVEEDDIFSDDHDEIKLFVNSRIDYHEEILLDIDNKKEYAYISKEKLLAMSNRDYLENSNLGKKFLKELSELFVIPKEEAIYNMNMLALDIQMRSINEIMEDVLHGIDVNLGKADRFIVEQIFNDFLKNIPLWKFKGSTINQLKINTPKDNLENKKIGRNEPCPCGSGKKYKNCCGKIIQLFN